MLAHDIDADVPLTWQRIVLSCASYILFFTDIPRSGYGFKELPTGYSTISETLFTCFGPWAYPVITVTKTPSGTIEGSIPQAKVWSYKYDSCSVGLRTIVNQYNVSGWDPCLLYEGECDYSMLDPAPIFPMLENVISAVQAEPSPTWRLHYSYTNILSEFFAYGLFRNRVRRTTRSHYIASPGVDLCVPGYPTRPFFCEQPWTDFGAQSVARINRIMDDIQAKLTEALARADARTQRVDMLLLDSADDLRTWNGGLAVAGTSAFDVVTLLRVQNCTDAHHTQCTTVAITDYRYEGVIGLTATRNYYRFVRLLRLVGQLYNIGRVALLFAGCYFARTVEAKYARAPLKTKLWCALRTFLRIPAQVVIYGSWFPVLLFSIAHIVDVSFLYATIFYGFIVLNGAVNVTLDQIYTLGVLLTCHMRNVWLLSLASKVVVVANYRRRKPMIVGFCGYLLPLTSLLSIVFEIRVNGERDTHLEFISAALPTPNLAFIRELQSVPSDFRYWGIFSDIKNLFLAGVITYALGRWLFGQPMMVPTVVPYTLLRHCNRSMFSTAWQSSRYVGKARDAVHFEVVAERQAMRALQHITWLTDPVQYLSLLWNQPVVYAYTVVGSNARVVHALGPQELARVDKALSKTVQRVEEVYLLDLAWHERIYCQ
ncbi:hypothetical protein ACHHYP_06161 [Achlya hypogyna]|uniref:Transmembrane protein n=1 Tax=Achlya hypogyna TaxID=1202772 RepID=A0A1V9YV14_ACHHY|nr:hypothetical protein ACHHYP_06161 [Achlya hypogyna]